MFTVCKGPLLCKQAVTSHHGFRASALRSCGALPASVYARSEARKDVDRILHSPSPRHVLWVKGPASWVLQGITLHALPALQEANGPQGEARYAPGGAAGGEGSHEEPHMRGQEGEGGGCQCSCGSALRRRHSCRTAGSTGEVERTGVVREGDEVVGVAVGWDTPVRFTSAAGGDLSPAGAPGAAGRAARHAQVHPPAARAHAPGANPSTPFPLPWLIAVPAWGQC